MDRDCIVSAINVFSMVFTKKNSLFQIPVPMDSLIHRFFEVAGVPSVYSPKADLKRVLSNSSTTVLSDAFNRFFPIVL